MAVLLGFKGTVIRKELRDFSQIENLDLDEEASPLENILAEKEIIYESCGWIDDG